MAREIDSIRLIDIASEARELYGNHADEIAGRKLPEHEWRFEVIFVDGARATMHFDATAEHIAGYAQSLQLN